MTTLRIALIEPWPGRRMGGRGFRISSFLVVLADDAAGRALPIWLNGPEGHSLFRGDGDHPHPEPSEVITASLLRAAGVTVTAVDIDALDTALTTGPQHGRGPAQAAARIEFTAAGAAEPRQLPVRIGYALAMAAATDAPIRLPDELTNQLAVPARDDLAGQFSRDVPLPPRRRRWPRLFRGHPQFAWPLADDGLSAGGQAGYWSCRAHTSSHSSSVSVRPAERISASSWKYSSRGGPGANMMSIRAGAPLSLEKAWIPPGGT